MCERDVERMQKADETMVDKDLVGAIVLAAGKGTRMKTNRPKVVHELLGLPMIWYVHQAVGSIVPTGLQWTVVGYGWENVQEVCTGYCGHFVHQDRQLGTGHAVVTAWPG